MPPKGSRLQISAQAVAYQIHATKQTYSASSRLCQAMLQCGPRNGRLLPCLPARTVAPQQPQQCSQRRLAPQPKGIKVSLSLATRCALTGQVLWHKSSTTLHDMQIMHELPGSVTVVHLQECSLPAAAPPAATSSCLVDVTSCLTCTAACRTRWQPRKVAAGGDGHTCQTRSRRLPVPAGPL